MLHLACVSASVKVSFDCWCVKAYSSYWGKYWSLKPSIDFHCKHFFLLCLHHVGYRVFEKHVSGSLVCLVSVDCWCLWENKIELESGSPSYRQVRVEAEPQGSAPEICWDSVSCSRTLERISWGWSMKLLLQVCLYDHSPALLSAEFGVTSWSTSSFIRTFLTNLHLDQM